MAEIIASGDWWTFDNEGTLDIFIEGAMPDYTLRNKAPWDNNYRYSIYTVILRDSVTSIGDYAFCYCTNLTSVTIPDSVTSIGNYAFYCCTNLTSVTILDSVTEIGASAFRSCENLTSITIPGRNTVVGGNAFFYCIRLTSIALSQNAIYNISTSNSFGSNPFGDCPIADITILDGVTTIYRGAFSNYASLTRVTIPDSVTSIEDSAFSGCRALSSITIPDSVTSIGISVFNGCRSLTSVTIPQAAIRQNVFYGCPVADITISDGATVISRYAFYQYASLNRVTIPDSVTGIETAAFAGCTALSSVTIPDSVTSIGDSAFSNCRALTSITIPDSVTSIGGWAFSSCSSLTRITIPGNIPSIVESAFWTGSNLRHIYYRGFEYDWNNASGTENFNNDIIHYVPPVLHVGGALDNGRIRGARFAFAPGEYVELSYVQSASMDGDEVQSDELYAELRVERENPETWLSGWEGVSRTVPVWFTRYGQIDGHDTVSVIERREKYYFKSLERVARQNFLLTAQSPIGRLTCDFAGGMYDGEALSGVLSAVVGDIPHTVDSRLNNIGVYGWAPYQSQRETLHMLELACGFVIRHDRNCDLYFTLPDSGSEGLPDEVIFHGGAVDYRIGTAYAGAEISEYTFLRTPNDKEVTLFDNTDGSGAADGLTVVFPDAPVYGLTASEGLTVDWANVNAAVVSGVGVLTGKAYTVVTGMTYLSAENDADPEQVLSIRDIPLITNLNSETVARKFLSSANAPVVEMDFLRQRQRPGDLFAFADPYGAQRTGYLLSMSGSLTSLERVTGTFLSGYVPVWGNTYNAVTVLNGVGEWTVPDSLDGATVRVVLIGGGTGGASGQRGSDATASGCGHGTPGDGGKVYVVRLTVHAGESYGYRCGAGGLGGEPSAEYDTDGDDEDKKTYRNNPGTAGGASVFELTQGGVVVGQWTSDDGEATAVGYRDMIDGIQYAAPGPDSGQDGGAATTGHENNDRSNPAYTDTDCPTLSLPLDEFRNWTYNGQIYDSATWTSGGAGNGGHYHQDKVDDYPAFDAWAYGGLGGGAAVGNNGGDGGDVGHYTTDTGGAGGHGADALPIFPEDTRAYGSGGSGGHGGGEGGAGGRGNTTEETGTALNGARGAGGSGSRGQDGKAGCILIYYHG